MLSPRRVVIALVAGAIALGTVGAGSAVADKSAGKTKDPVTVRLGYFPNVTHAPAIVGVDTGLVHLAAALGTPTVSLFVSTDAKLAGVERASAFARDLGGVGQVPSVDAVLDAAGALLRRAPRC